MVIFPHVPPHHGDSQLSNIFPDIVNKYLNTLWTFTSLLLHTNVEEGGSHFSGGIIHKQF